jgi:hypothetical protein
VDAITGHAPTTEPGGEVLKECSRAAQIKIGFAGYAQFFEGRNGQPAGSIEIKAQPVSRRGAAVPDVAPSLWQVGQQIAYFSGEGMIQAAARSIDPPDRARRGECRQRVEHGQHRRHAHAGTQQHYRAVAVPQGERAAGRAHVEDVAHPNLPNQVSAGDSVRLLLDGDAITGAVRYTGQRVAAQDRRRVGLRTESQHDELPGQGDGQGAIVCRLQHQRDRAAAFAIHSGHF